LRPDDRIGPGPVLDDDGLLPALGKGSASARAATSTEMPGLNGVMIRTVCSGQLPAKDCAWRTTEPTTMAPVVTITAKTRGKADLFIAGSRNVPRMANLLCRPELVRPRNTAGGSGAEA